MSLTPNVFPVLGIHVLSLCDNKATYSCKLGNYKVNVCGTHKNKLVREGWKAVKT